MFEDSDPRHELWDEEEEEEEEEEEGDGAGSQGSPGQEAPEGDQWRSRTQFCGRQDRAPWGLWEEPCLSASQNGAGPTGCSGAEAGPREKDPPSSWICDREAIFRPTEQAVRCPFRTLSHPSFQAFYTAVSIRNQAGPPLVGDTVSPSGSRPKPGPLPILDCSSFFYTDPTMPPGHRIYNWLSSSSQEVFHSLRLNTPAPVMSACEATPALPHKEGLSELERKAVSALLALPAGVACGSGAGPSLPGAEEEVQGCKKMPAPDPFL